MYLLASATLEAPALLRHILAEHYGLAALPPMARMALGKPYFPDHPSIHFNLSHSGHYTLCAVGEVPVGVDIELVRPRSDTLPARVLTPAELAWYRARGGQWSDFYTLWTGKEAWCKREGRGVVGPRDIEVPLPGTSAALRHLSGPDWAVAVCTQAAIPVLRWLNY